PDPALYRARADRYDPAVADLLADHVVLPSRRRYLPLRGHVQRRDAHSVATDARKLPEDLLRGVSPSAVQFAVRQLHDRAARRVRQLDGGLCLRGLRVSVQEGAVRLRVALLHDAIRVDRHPALHADADAELDR